MKQGSIHGVMVIIRGNGLSELSSNPGHNFLFHIALKPLKKSMSPTVLSAVAIRAEHFEFRLVYSFEK